MRQDALRGDWSDGLNARQLQEVILEGKGAVCRIFTCLAVFSVDFLVYYLRHVEHKLWLLAPELTDCVS